jgi:ferredoxin-NADP reductase
MEHEQLILSISEMTHNVRCIRIKKPEGYSFVPGQATEVAINKPRWREEKRPFTFTGLNDDPYLEFTIKCYDDHDGVTNQVRSLQVGDQLIIDDPWGAIEYKGEGYFIAGGAGITPFIAILRQLSKDNRLETNKLFFSNRTVSDIIDEDLLSALLGPSAIYLVTDAPSDRYYSGFIDEQFLLAHVDDFTKRFYICGPDKMVSDISKVLTSHGADPEAVIFEK